MDARSHHALPRPVGRARTLHLDRIPPDPPRTSWQIQLTGTVNRSVNATLFDVLAPIIEARLDLCRAKGFDSADADNLDGYANTTGFPLTADDQLAFNVFVANAANARGLSIALKNDLGQIPQLVAYYDWSLNEQCAQHGAWRSPCR